MTQLTFITGKQGSGKTQLAMVLAKHYQALGARSMIASEENLLGDWSRAEDIEKLRGLDFPFVLVDCFCELPDGLKLQKHDVHIHMERAS